MPPSSSERVRDAPPDPGRESVKEHGTLSSHRERGRAGAWVAAVGSLVLLGSLFLDWYGYSRAGSRTAWQAFSATDVLLAALAGVIIVSAALAVVQRNTATLRNASGLVLGIAGIAALGLVAARFLVPPGGAEVLGVLGTKVDAARLGGVFIALAAAIGVCAGGVIAASGVVLDGVSSALERVDRGL